MVKFVNKKIAIIGGGHIGLALVEGFINSGKIAGSQLIVANPSLSKIIHLKNREIEITTDNKSAVQKADMIFLAVKHFVIEQVLTEISSLVEKKQVISPAAIVTINHLRRYVTDAEIVRIMPNMAISCNQGVIGLFTDQTDKKQVRQLVSLLGLVVEVNREEDLDTLTLLSGCGPAIVSQFIEILAHYGIINGLSADKSHALVLQTFKGTIDLLNKSGIAPDELIQSVATKGGITEAIINKLKQRDFQNRFTQAVDHGYTKIKELDQKLNKEL